jgi:hypothetical protein
MNECRPYKVEHGETETSVPAVNLFENDFGLTAAPAAVTCHAHATMQVKLVATMDEAPCRRGARQTPPTS